MKQLKFNFYHDKNPITLEELIQEILYQYSDFQYSQKLPPEENALAHEEMEILCKTLVLLEKSRNGRLDNEVMELLEEIIGPYQIK